MKKTMFLVAMSVVGMNSLADPSVMETLKELFRLEQEEMNMAGPREGIRANIGKLKERTEPIVKRELAKLAEGEVTPLMRDLLNDPETAHFSFHFLITRQLPAYSPRAQAVAFNTIFPTVSNPLRGRFVVFPFFFSKSMFSDVPKERDLAFSKEMFSGKEVQEWLVGKINSGLPAGAAYFILTDESAGAVMETARASMKLYTKAKDYRAYTDSNLFHLLSAVFLASRMDEDAIRLLDSLLGQCSIDERLGATYIIQAAAMSGNGKLVQKIRGMITTDMRGRNGTNPIEQIAANACSVMIEGFPSVASFDEHYNNYDEDIKKRIRDWLRNNPTHTIRPDSARIFFYGGPFQNILFAMLKAGWDE